MAAGNRTPVSQKLLDAQKTLNSTGPRRKVDLLERGLNFVGNVHDRMTDPGTSQITSAIPDAAKEVWKALEPRLQNWEQRYEMLEKALDSIAGLHPAIGVAVVVFKAAISFEVTRRQNDQKIAILRVTMMNTMEELTCLETALPADPALAGELIARHLEGIIIDITSTIKRCATTCDSYQNRHVIVRALKSIPWAQKLASFVEDFDSLKQRLRDSIQLHIAGSVQQHASQLAALNAKVDSLLLIFQNLRTPLEQRIYDYMWKGTPIDKRSSILQDETQVDAVIREFGQYDLLDDTTAGGELAVGSAPRSGIKTDLSGEIKWDLKSDLDAILKKWNNASFAKFEASQERLKVEMQVVIKRDGDRVISRILAGPHDGIKDPSVWKVWTEMGWRRCTEARLLVKALREYYAEVYSSLLAGDTDAALGPVNVSADSRVGADDTLTDVALKTVENREVELMKKVNVFSLDDGWTLKYISMLRVHPLLERLDQDFSGWVTVKEVNSFTEARPVDWSVPCWMAYWTIGQALVTAYYYSKIQHVLWGIHRSWKKVLDCNRTQMDAFMYSYAGAATPLHQLLAGAYAVAHELQEDQALFSRFKNYTLEKERQLMVFLEKIGYYLDAPNTVALLLGPDNLEQDLMPICYLMALRIQKIVDLAQATPLHEHELHDMNSSHTQLMQAAYRRIYTVKRDICLANDLPEKDTIKKFACGLFYYLEYTTEWPDSAYYDELDWESKIPPFISMFMDELQDATSDVVVSHGDYSALRYSTPTLLDFEPYGTPLVEPRKALEVFYPPGGQISLHQPQPTLWQGPFAMYGSYTITRIELKLPYDTGDVEGFGLYVGGQFGIRGKREGSSLVLRTTRTSDATDGPAVLVSGSDGSDRSFVSGVINEAGDSISGPCTHNRPDEDSWSPVQDHEMCCIFEVQLRPPEYFSIFRPPQSDFETNKPKALWTFAREAIYHVVRVQLKKIPRWTWFKAMRECRRTYIELYSRAMDPRWMGIWNFSCLNPIEPEEIVELQRLERILPLATIKFYRSLAYFLMRRQVIHDLLCDFCPRRGLRRTFLACLDCLAWLRAREGDKADILYLCVECAKVDFVSTRRGHQPHKTSHRLLQIRRPLTDEAVIVNWATEGLAMLKDMFHNDTRGSAGDKAMNPAADGDGKEVSAGEDAATGGADEQGFDEGPECLKPDKDTSPEGTYGTQDKQCGRCNVLVEAPFWYCVECSGQVYVCEECNAQDDRDRAAFVSGWQDIPLIRGKWPAEGTQHKWQHTMLLWQEDPEDMPGSSPNAQITSEVSQEERLKAVEERTQRLETYLLEIKTMLSLLAEKLQASGGDVAI